MRRSRRLCNDLSEILSGGVHIDALSERMIINRQANLMFTAERRRTEEAEAAAAKALRSELNLLSQDEIDTRLRSIETEHAVAASRHHHRPAVSPTSSSAMAMNLKSANIPKFLSEEATTKRLACPAPPNWPTALRGWMMMPSTGLSNTTPSASASNPASSSSSGNMTSSSYSECVEPPMVVTKTFAFLDQPQTYKFLGHVGAAVEELGFPRTAEVTALDSEGNSITTATATTPSSKTQQSKKDDDATAPAVHHPYATPCIEWMWSEVTVTMLSTPQTYVLAQFLGDLELRLGVSKNFSTDGLEASGKLWSGALRRKIEDRASTGFLWMFNEGDRNSIAKYMQTLYVQWCNRAEYLISRKSRERKEFRPNLTLTEAMAAGAERRRRSERRKFKDKLSDATAKSMGMEKEDFERYSVDTLPRELREQMEEDRSKVGGMQEPAQRFGGHQSFSRASQW